MGKMILNGKEYIRDIPSPFPPIIYSKEEREVGVWTDGKPLYEKTVTVPVSSCTITNKVMTIPFKGDNEKLLRIVDAFTSDSTYSRIEYGGETHASNSTDTNYIRFGWYYGSFCLYTANTSYWTNLEDITIIYQYTKTTDTAGSGTWTTQGTLSHHYSTNEQVIGTWIDGKPIYEKSYLYENSSGSSASSEIVIVNDFGTDKQCIPGGLQGMFYNQSSGANYSVPWADVNGSSGNSTGLWVGDGKIKLRIRNDSYSNNYKLRIIARYTKSTD